MARRKQKPEVTMDMNLGELIEKFSSNDRCRAYLELLRWHDDVTCPRCQCGVVTRIANRPQFDCNSCHYHFSVTTGTILNDTHLPLWKWFAAAYMMIEAKKGVSANQLKRTLSVSYKTAWYLCHRIRKAMEEAWAPLSGTVEMDETWIGGKRRHVGSGYVGNKTMVLGAIERDGDVCLRIERRRDAPTLHAFADDVCADETERIYTDDHGGYQGIGDENTIHESVNHRAEEWVRGDVHTNSMEGVWSLFKRAVVGSYHRVSAKHLDRYLNEFEFRFNNRQNQFLFRDTIMKLIEAPTMTYAELIGKGEPVAAIATPVATEPQPTEWEPF
jgi:transposase-like protein